jgi:hypothetical protein
MNLGPAIAEFSAEVRRHPYFYEPTLVTIALVVPLVLARQVLPPVAGIAGWLLGTAGGFLLWALIRLGPLVRFVPQADRDRTRFFHSVSAYPLGSLLLGFAASSWCEL